MRGTSRINQPPASIFPQSLFVMVATLTAVLICSGWLIGVGIALHQVEHAKWHVFVPSGYHATIDKRLVHGTKPDALYHSIQLRRPWSAYDEFLYTVTFHSDGHAELDVVLGPSRPGLYVGDVSQEDFNRLGELVELMSFSDLAHEYTSDSSHASRCEVSVTGKLGTKTVTDAGSVGPTGLWALQECIDGVRQRIDWKPK